VTTVEERERATLRKRKQREECATIDQKIKEQEQQEQEAKRRRPPPNTPEYMKVWEYIVHGTGPTFESLAKPGGSTRGVYECAAIDVDGVAHRAVLKVLKNGDSVGELMREAELLGSLSEGAKAARVQRVVRTVMHPDGIVIESTPTNVHCAILCGYLSNKGGDRLAKVTCAGPGGGEGGQPLELQELLLRSIRSFVTTIASAHGQLICHRDIKSANVRVDEEGLAFAIDWGGSMLATAQWPREQMKRDHCAFDDDFWKNRPSFYVKKVIANNQKQKDIVGVIRDNSASLVGFAGTTCGRAPEVIKAYCTMKGYYKKHKRDGKDTKELQRDLHSRMAVSGFALPADCYAMGLLILRWIAGRDLLELANEHWREVRSHKGEMASGPYFEGNKVGANYFEPDNRLSFFVQERIHGVEKGVAWANALRSFRGLGPLPPASERNKVGLLWMAYSKVLRGLLATEPSERWTAAHALEMLQGLKSTFSSKARPQKNSSQQGSGAPVPPLECAGKGQAEAKEMDVMEGLPRPELESDAKATGMENPFSTSSGTARAEGVLAANLYIG
jgi:serine/threonine protein kinase